MHRSNYFLNLISDMAYWLSKFSFVILPPNLDLIQTCFIFVNITIYLPNVTFYDCLDFLK